MPECKAKKAGLIFFANEDPRVQLGVGAGLGTLQDAIVTWIIGPRAGIRFVAGNRHGFLGNLLTGGTLVNKFRPINRFAGSLTDG